LRAIQEVMVSQRVAYVFPYSSFEFVTDIGFVVLGEGRKSAFFQVRPVVILSIIVGNLMSWLHCVDEFHSSFTQK
jgi:hypothetical protein